MTYSRCNVVSSAMTFNLSPQTEASPRREKLKVAPGISST
jgi:hypothetical protein